MTRGIPFNTLRGERHILGTTSAGCWHERDSTHPQQTAAIGISLTSQLLLAFLCQTIPQLVNTLYHQARAALATRKEFFDDVQALTRYLCFDDWESPLGFMAAQLDLSPG